jgi:hypothetical protein
MALVQAFIDRPPKRVGRSGDIDDREESGGPQTGMAASNARGSTVRSVRSICLALCFSAQPLQAFCEPLLGIQNATEDDGRILDIPIYGDSNIGFVQNSSTFSFAAPPASCSQMEPGTHAPHRLAQNRGFGRRPRKDSN